MTGPRISVRPSLPLRVYATSPERALPWPLDDPACRLYARARHGIWHGLRALGLGPGDELLVPAYNHGSEIEAIVRAGITCRFYETPPDLVPDETELEALVRAHPEIKGLFLIHYLGFPQDSTRWRRWCDDRDLLLVEDAAQGFLAAHDGSPVGQSADLAVFCIYKTYGVIDGAAMVCSRPPPQSPVRSRLRLAQTLRRNAATIAQSSALLARIRARVSRSSGYSIERDFGLGTSESAPARSTTALLSRVLAKDAAEGRRDNYRYLLERLEEFVPPAWRSLPDGASPFCFPVEGAKREWFEALGAQGVIALNLWSVPHPVLEESRFEDAARFRARVLGLPVHQELQRRHLDRVVEVFRSVASAG